MIKQIRAPQWGTKNGVAVNKVHEQTQEKAKTSPDNKVL